LNPKEIGRNKYEGLNSGRNSNIQMNTILPKKYVEQTNKYLDRITNYKKPQSRQSPNRLLPQIVP
jgi:hypothetical protein